MATPSFFLTDSFGIIPLTSKKPSKEKKKETPKKENEPEKKEEKSETGFQVLPDTNIKKLLEYLCFGNGGVRPYDIYKTWFDEIMGLFKTNSTVKFIWPTCDILLGYHKSKYQVNCVTTKNAFAEYGKFLTGYLQYSQHYHIYDGNLLDTEIIKDETYFDLHQISNILGYASSGYLAAYYGKNHGIKTVRVGRHVFTDKVGLREVLSRGRKPGCRSMLEQLDLSTKTKIQSAEADVLEEIIEFLKEDKIEYELQYPVGDYHLDMYLPKSKVGVEVDEHGHSDRNPVYEKEREEFIKKHLTKKLLRINPHAPNFRMAKELGRLATMMTKQ